MTAYPKLRLSRQTKDIELLLPFYRDGLGFEVLDRWCPMSTTTMCRR